MSAAFALGCLNKETPESIERIGHHLYRVKVRSGHELLNNTFIGVGFDWHIAATEKPFRHLPFESFLAISVLRYEMPNMGAMSHIKGYIPNRISATSYAVRTSEGERYIGFLMDWRNQLTEEPLADLGLQAGLSYFLLIWLAHFKEWEYAEEMERRFYDKRIGVPHSGNRRGGEKLPPEP